MKLSPLALWGRHIEYLSDALDEETIVDASGSPVMTQRSLPYMLRCVDGLKITSECDVLEIGFGMGFAATEIQRCKPRSHTIVECSETVLEHLRPWAADRPGVRVIEGSWQ